MTIANYAENALLEVVRALSTVYVKLHTGDPGEAGTANAAGETTRQLVTFAAASGGAMATDSDAAWTSVSTSETYSHVSLWDNVSAGNCWWTGPLDHAQTMSAGDDYTIPAGDLILTVD